MLKKKEGVTLFLLALVLVFAGESALPQSTGSGAAAVDQVIEQVKRAHCPTAGYRVRVTQQLENISYDGSPLEIPPQEEMALYSPENGLKRHSTAKERDNESVPIPKVMVDVSAYARDIETYPQRTMVRDKLDSREHYVVQGIKETTGQKCILWVDSEEFSISRIEMYLHQKLFATIDVESQLHDSRYWLPTRVTLVHATDDSRVILDYKAYEFDD